MVLKADKDRVTTLLKDTITLLCKNGLTFKSKFSVDALIGVTLDEDEVFLVSIKELVKSDKLLAGESGLEEGSYAEESDDSATSPRKRRRRKKRKHDRAETDGDDSDNQGEASSQEGDSMDQQPDSKRLMLKVKEEQQDEDEDADIMFIKEELDDWSRVSQQNDTAQSQQAAYFSNKFPMNSPTGSQNYSALSGGSGQGQELDGGGMWNPGGTPNQSMQGQYRLLPNTSGTSQAGPGSESGQVRIAEKSCDICGKFFKSRKGMVAHRKLHEGIYPYCCGICGRGCASTNHLKRHVMSQHPGAPTFTCDICHKCFYSEEHYKKHLGRWDHKVSVSQENNIN